MARISRSLMADSPLRAAVNHASTVSKWLPTSVPRISSNTGSTLTDVVCASPAASAATSTTGSAGAATAPACTSGSVDINTSSPAAKRSAAASMAGISTLTLPVPSKAACNCGNSSRDKPANPTTAELAGREPSSTRLNMLSTCHANSPNTLAPTKRPLPLRVWYTRRIGRRRSASSGAMRQAGISSSRLAISSWNSSRKISRISSSISSPIDSKPAATGCALPDTTAAAAAGAVTTTACGSLTFAPSTAGGVP